MQMASIGVLVLSEEMGSMDAILYLCSGKGIFSPEPHFRRYVGHPCFIPGSKAISQSEAICPEEFKSSLYLFKHPESPSSHHLVGCFNPFEKDFCQKVTIDIKQKNISTKTPRSCSISVSRDAKVISVAETSTSTDMKHVRKEHVGKMQNPA